MKKEIEQKIREIEELRIREIANEELDKRVKPKIAKTRGDPVVELN